MTSSPQWSGDMLDRPEMVEAFTAQLRKLLGSHADYVARIRRDAEAMWDANPPAGYSTFEAWWRARWVKGPLAEIQEHLEKAAALTFKLEARYRRGRHELPAARQAAKQPKTGAPELGSGRFGDRTRTTAARPAAPADEGDFMDLVRRQRGERSA
ncbi:Uncharacterised protein [Mycobacterium tuberculosis]|nr:Uncharacterised protein [Mycobacterium tuberculosis]